MRKALKSLYLNPVGQIGGAENVLLNLLSGVREQSPRADVTLIAAADGPLVRRARLMKVKTRVLRFPRALSEFGDSGLDRGRRRSRIGVLAMLPAALRAAVAAVGYIRRLSKVVRAADPDVIQTNGLKMHILASWLKLPGVPLIWHVHDYVSQRPLMRILIRLHARRCRLAIVPSRSVAADFETVCRGRVSICCVYNGIDLDRFSPVVANADSDDVPGERISVRRDLRIGLVATFARWKGQEVFLEALALLPPELPFRAYMVGGPVYQTRGSQYTLDELRDRARKLGVEDRVVFTGYVGETAAVIRSLDIVVHGSTRPEPFGLVIAEAMACGKAVIVASHGGAAELIEEGVTALAHHPGDAVSLAAKIRVLAENERLRLRLGRAARETAVKRFDRRRLAAQILLIYESLLVERPIGWRAAA